MSEDRHVAHPDEDLLAAWILDGEEPGEEPEEVARIRRHVADCASCAQRIAALQRLGRALDASASAERAERAEGTEGVEWAGMRGRAETAGQSSAEDGGWALPARLRWGSLERARKRVDLAWALASLAAVGIVVLAVPRSTTPGRDSFVTASNAAEVGSAIRTQLIEALSTVPAGSLDSLFALPAVVASVNPAGDASGAIGEAYEMRETEREALYRLLNGKLNEMALREREVL